MSEQTSLYDTLVDELESMRSELPAEEGGSFFNRPMSEQELVEWLSFQAYYEKRAAEFIGRCWPTPPSAMRLFFSLSRSKMKVFTMSIA